MKSKAKPERKKRGGSSRAAHGSATDRNGEYQADFLWPHDEGTVDQAGYEFANAKTEEYRKVWWHILLERAKAQNADISDRR